MKSGVDRFVEFEGHVHLVFREHTVCGVAFDAVDSERDESLRWKSTGKRVVDCEMCCLVIEACKGVKTA